MPLVILKITTTKQLEDFMDQAQPNAQNPHTLEIDIQVLCSQKNPQQIAEICGDIIVNVISIAQRDYASYVELRIFNAAIAQKINPDFTTEIEAARTMTNNKMKISFYQPNANTLTNPVSTPSLGSTSGSTITSFFTPTTPFNPSPTLGPSIETLRKNLIGTIIQKTTENMKTIKAEIQQAYSDSPALAEYIINKITAGEKAEYDHSPSWPISEDELLNFGKYQQLVKDHTGLQFCKNIIKMRCPKEIQVMVTYAECTVKPATQELEAFPKEILDMFNDYLTGKKQLKMSENVKLKTQLIENITRNTIESMEKVKADIKKFYSNQPELEKYIIDEITKGEKVEYSNPSAWQIPEKIDNIHQYNTILKGFDNFSFCSHIINTKCPKAIQIMATYAQCQLHPDDNDLAELTTLPEEKMMMFFSYLDNSPSTPANNKF